MTNTHTQAMHEVNTDARINLLPVSATVVAGSPTNSTAWLIANRRRGAMLYTAPSTNGLTLAVIDTPTHYTANKHYNDKALPIATDSDIAQIVARRASLAQTDKEYNG